MKLNNAQRFVFTSLLIVLALEYGSFTKFKTIWGMAFNADVKVNAKDSSTVTTVKQIVKVKPVGHATVGLPVVGIWGNLLG